MTWTSDVLDAIQEQIRQKGLSHREIGARLGHSHTWLGKRLRGQTDLTLEDIEGIGRVVGFDPLEVLIHARFVVERRPPESAHPALTEPLTDATVTSLTPRGPVPQPEAWDDAYLPHAARLGDDRLKHLDSDDPA
jgi:hypothetical protein